RMSFSFYFSSRRRHTRFSRDWSSDVCSSDLFTAIMGPSGSGKSTLMHCLAGLDTATSGSVRVGDVELTGLGDKQLTLLRRERIGFVFQAFNLLPTLSAEENILLPLRIAARQPDQVLYDRVIDTVGL